MASGASNGSGAAGGKGDAGSNDASSDSGGTMASGSNTAGGGATPAGGDGNGPEPLEGGAGGGSAGTPSSPSTEYDGRWEGLDKQNQPVAWTVREGRVESFMLGVRASYAGYSCRGVTEQADPAPIASSVAVVETDVPNAALPITATITFDSTVTAHGLTGELYANGLFCKNPLIISIGTSDSRIVPAYEFQAHKLDSGSTAGGGAGQGDNGEPGAGEGGSSGVPPEGGEAGTSFGGAFGE